MTDQGKTPAQLSSELAALRERLAELETQRRQAQNEGRQLRKWIDSITQSIIEGVVIENAEGHFTFVNRAVASMLGYTVEELNRMTNLDVTDLDDAETSHERLQALVHGEIDTYRLEKRFVRKDGGRTAGRFRFHAHPVHEVVHLHDVASGEDARDAGLAVLVHHRPAGHGVQLDARFPGELVLRDETCGDEQAVAGE